MELAKMLLDARKRASLSRADVAESCGVSRTTVWKWETGARSPDLAQLEAYLDRIGFSGAAQTPFFLAAGGPGHVLKPADGAASRRPLVDPSTLGAA